MPGTKRHRAVWRVTLDRDVGRAENLLDPGVRAVDLMLTTGCNLRCAYCYQQRGAMREMAPEVLDAAIRRLVSSRLDRPRLTLFGGEPLLAVPLVRRALGRVREWAPPRMKPDVRIFTNGTRLDEEMTHLLASRDVHITLSFDGVAPAQDDRRTGSFELLDRLLVRLRRDHPRHFRKRLAIKATLTSRNVPFLSESFNYFLYRGVRDLEFVPVLPDDAGWNARMARELDRQLTEVTRLSIQEFRRTGEVPFRLFRPGFAEPAADGTRACDCGSRGLLFVDVDGALAPCVAFAPSTFGARPRPLGRVLAALGGLHVTDPGLPAALIRREKRADGLRVLAGSANRQGPRGACARCKARPTCFVCPVAIACNGGRVPTFHCDVNRLFARHRAAFHRQTA
jgi:sulfatase maturation enzyme AslB (radical SAM superfamily)